MKEISEQMDSVVFLGTAHREVHRAWMDSMFAYNQQPIPNGSSLGSLDYALSLKLAKTFVKRLAENPEFDMSRVKVYDWCNSSDNLAVFVTVDGHIYDRDMDLPKVATRSVLEAMFIYYAGKAAMPTGVCYYLENGNRDNDKDYFCIKPWGDSTKWGEPYRAIKNNIYSVDEFLELDKVK